MGVSYFDCASCGDEMNDCNYPDAFWFCSGCDIAYCDACVLGRWASCGCSGFDYCPTCIKAGEVCTCGEFGCYLCQGKGGSAHTPGCPARPPRRTRRTRRKGG